MEQTYTNHLTGETSPYLLQHAHQPVDWYPWGEEAFEKAQKENKPVFLSIGYSTCHWCHVMARESFDDVQVAQRMNQYFVAVKVDKEERPDIDSIYMAVAQSLTGSGGWPLTIIMTPQGKPFFAGRYFPKKSRYGRVGMMDLIRAIGEKWQEDREDLVKTAGEIGEIFIKGQQAPLQKGALKKEVVSSALAQMKERFDKVYGGFSPAPKFPTPHYLLFLLYSHHLGLGDQGLSMVEKTLQSMYQGGLYDHVGFGFSRYATDKQWLVPHFEKMLYDNALLVMAYTQAYQVTKNPLYRQVAENTLTYVAREMTHPKGGFYSAQDADSQGEEGKYYTFTKEEILEVLGQEEGETFAQGYGVSYQGNFEGKNILNLLDKPLSPLDEKTREQLEQLYSYRLNRYPLHKDDKILTAWNAMMIGAFALAARVFKELGYTRTAEKAFSFLEKELTGEEGRLFVSFREGRAKGEVHLDDYAYSLWAALELYETTYDPRYLEKAKTLYEKVEELFADPAGGYFLSSVHTADLLYRPKKFYDGAVPSGNSVMAYGLLTLGRLLGETSMEERALELLCAYMPLMEEHPLGYTFALKALVIALYPKKELVCLVKEEEKVELSYALGEKYAPQMVVLTVTPLTKKALGALAPYTKAYEENRAPGFYLCENYACNAPVDKIEKILEKG